MNRTCSSLSEGLLKCVSNRLDEFNELTLYKNYEKGSTIYKDPNAVLLMNDYCYI